VESFYGKSLRLHVKRINEFLRSPRRIRAVTDPESLGLTGMRLGAGRHLGHPITILMILI